MILDSSTLQPPFALQECGDPEVLFFSNLQDILEDRHDCLWGEHYVGYDAKGQKFKLQCLVEEKRKFGFLKRYVDHRKIEEIIPGFAAEEAVDMIRPWLKSLFGNLPDIAKQLPNTSSNWIDQAQLPDLLALAIRFESIAAKTAWKAVK